MSQNITFKLRDKYSVKAWNPNLLGDKPNSLYGEYFFNVIYSVYVQTLSSNKSISDYASKILANLSADLSIYSETLKNKFDKLASGESALPFQCESHIDKNNEIALVGVGICPHNANFLKIFIAFDQYVSALSTNKTLGVIEDKEYYKNRKMVHGLLFSTISRYNDLSKDFHKSRKSIEKKLMAVG